MHRKRRTNWRYHRSDKKEKEVGAGGEEGFFLDGIYVTYLYAI